MRNQQFGIVIIVCDEIAHNLVHHDLMKYVEVDNNFIKENLCHHVITYQFLKFEEQLANAHKKAVSERVFHGVIDKLDVVDIYTLVWEGVLRTMSVIVDNISSIEYIL